MMWPPRRLWPGLSDGLVGRPFWLWKSAGGLVDRLAAAFQGGGWFVEVYSAVSQSIG